MALAIKLWLVVACFCDGGNFFYRNTMGGQYALKQHPKTKKEPVTNKQFKSLFTFYEFPTLFFQIWTRHKKIHVI